MDPLSEACLSLNVKDVESGQINIGGCWVVRIPAYNDVTFGESLKGSYWLLIDGLDHPMLIQEDDCFLVVNHLGYRTSSEPVIEPVDLRSPLARAKSVIWPTAVATRHPGEYDNTLIGARLVFEEAKSNFLFDLLPPIIHIPTNSAVAPVFRSMLHVLAGENAAGKTLEAKCGIVSHLGSMLGLGRFFKRVLIHYTHDCVA
jgi:hypothetical protein